MRVLIIFLLIFTKCSYADTEDIIKEQIEEIGYFDSVGKYSKEASSIIPELDNPTDMVTNIVSEGSFIDVKGVFSNILKYIGKEIVNNISFIVKIMIISIFCGILKGMQTNFGGSVSEIAFYACFILMISMLVIGFNDILNVGKEAINNISEFMQLAIPTVLTLMAASGNITFGATLYPVILLFIEIITTVFNFVLVPLLTFLGIFTIVSNIGGSGVYKKIGGLIKSTTVWIIGIVSTIFVAIITTQANIASSVDEVTVKTTKFAFSNIIPIVGKTLSDAVDTVLSCSVAIKNMTGWVSIVIILGIMLVPIVKVVVMMFIYKFSSAMIEPISDSRISNCLSDLSGVLGTVFAVMATISFVFVIALMIILKMNT